MKFGVIQASSQINKNNLLYQSVKMYANDFEVINFGCTNEEQERYSCIEIALFIGLLINSKSVDFVVTGCSSGQGMMLACNSIPGVLCGYVPTPKDAYLFAQINNGNAVSLPLGEEYTYLGEDNCRKTIQMLLSEPFGGGYPKSEAKRKIQDTKLLKSLRAKSQIDYIEFLDGLDSEIIEKLFCKKDVISYILEHSQVDALKEWLEKGLKKKDRQNSK